MAANFICEKFRLIFGDFDFVLSLIVHLSLLFAIGSKLPQSVGENRIFQVYLAAEPSASASSASTAPDHELNTELTKPSHPGPCLPPW